MKKVVRLTERDLTNIIKRVIQEETSPKGKDLITLLYSLRNSINDEDKEKSLSKLEDVFSIVRDMDDKPKSKRKVNENRHEEKDIFISKGFKGVRMEFGGESSASPSDIIELYNDYVEEGIPLVKYLGRDIFLNANDNEIDKYSVLDELNYAIVGDDDEQINYGDEEEEEDDMPSYKTKWRMPSDDEDFVNERLNNIINRVIKEDEDLKVNELTENPFYTFLKGKKYKMYKFDGWSKLPEYGEIKGSLEPFNYNGGDTLYFKNVVDSPLPYRLITDGKKVYFLDPGIPKTIKNYVDSLRDPSKSYNGPFTVFEIKKYL